MKAQFLFPLFGLLFAMRTLGSASTMGAEEILIGASVALTCKYSRTGREQLNGYRLWIAAINAKGGLLGKRVRLIR